MHKLTAFQIKNFKNRGLYGDGGGLYLQITESGNRSWVFRYRVGTKLRNHGLGPLHTISLAEAREAAQECRKMRLAGIDPIDEVKKRKLSTRLEAAKSISFRDCAEAYIKAQKSAWKNEKHLAQWKSTLVNYAYPEFGDFPVGEVDVKLLLKVLQPIWEQKNETASRLRGRIEKVLDYAKVLQYRDGENPALWRGNLEHMLAPRSKLKRVKHHAALPYTEMADFWTELAEQSGTGAEALRFAILTAVRTGEVIGATWAEIDLDAKIWTIPAHRMKAGSEHRVPLSDLAISILKTVKNQRRGDYVFPGMKSNSPLSNMAMANVLKRMERTDITVHGFRSTFRDWCAEETNTAREVAEMALAHTISNKVEAAYRRGDLFEKRKVLMGDWAKYCAD